VQSTVESPLNCPPSSVAAIIAENRSGRNDFERKNLGNSRFDARLPQVANFLKLRFNRQAWPGQDSIAGLGWPNSLAASILSRDSTGRDSAVNLEAAASDVLLPCRAIEPDDTDSISSNRRSTTVLLTQRLTNNSRISRKCSP